ncbi:MAG: MFS transporter [Candidatus Thorarchaeota archaeon]
MKTLKIQFKSEEQRSIVNKFSLIISVFFAGIAGYSYFAFLPIFLYSKGFSAGEITFIMTWMGVGTAIFSWFFGRISDRTGRRKLFFIFALFSQIIIFLLLNLNNHIIFHCILNFSRGSLLGMMTPASNALFADIVEKTNKKNELDKNLGTIEVSGIQLSLLNATTSSGWAIGVLGSSFVISIFGVESLILFLIITTAMALLFAIPVQDIKKEVLVRMEIEPEIATEVLLIQNKEQVKLKSNRKRAKVKFLLFISVFFRQFGVIPFLQIISLILIDAGIPIGLAGVVIALNPILQVLAMVIMGRAVDNPKISEKIMLAVGFILSSLTLLCYAVGSAIGNIPFFILGQICLGFGWGCIYTGAVKYIINRAPLDRAFYMGIWITDLQVAKIISYQVFAFLWLIFSPTLVLPYAALIPLIGVVLAFWL